MIRRWGAHQELKLEIDDMTEILQLIEQLVKQ
jgi:hypothetical protein